MKAKIYTLQTQKTDLDRRILEMQSTTASLEDEQRTIGSALEEKENEIKLLRERKIGSNNDNPQLTTLTEILRQKEAEIKDLKHQLELPVGIWSVSSDDPSNPAINLTTKRTKPWRNETEVSKNEEESAELHKSTSYGDVKNSTTGTGGREDEATNDRDGENSTLDGYRKENGVRTMDRREMTGDDESQRLKISQEKGSRQGSAAGKNRIEQSREKSTENSQSGEGFSLGEEKGDANGNYNDINRPRDEESATKAIDGNDVQLGKLAGSQEGDNQEYEVNYKGGMKLEMPDNFLSRASYRLRGNNGPIRKSQGKRWRMIAKNKVPENIRNPLSNGIASMRGRRSFKETRETEGNKMLGAGENTGRMESGGQKRRGHLPEVTKALVNHVANLPDPGNTADSQDMNIKGGNKYRNSQDEKYQRQNVKYEASAKHPNSAGKVPTARSVNGETIGTAGNAKKQKQGEVKLEKQATDTQAQTERRDIDEVDDGSMKEIAVVKDEEPEDLEVEDIKAAEREISRVSAFNLEGAEENKEQTDEPEY